MICTHCTHEAGSAKFCPKCGHALVRACPQCQTPLAPEANFCGECGTPVASRTESEAPREAAPESGERRQLTVLFCDLVGSTELSGRLDPEEWQDVVRRYQDAASAVIEPLGGHVAQFLGDGLLVYFGYPQAHDDDAERAVRAGLGIVNAMQALDGLSVSLTVRIGIHTGPVVVSTLGGGAHRETLALGETTNVAARLQGVAVPDTVIVSAATLQLVTGIFVIEDLGPQHLKGVAQPVAAAHEEAIGHLRHAIDLLATRPEGTVRDGREGALQLALAASLRPARGIAHPGCEAAYERARVLAETVGDARGLGLALGGLASTCSNRGEVERGRVLAARLLTTAEQSGDRELVLLGHAELSVAEHSQGKFASALSHSEAVRSSYEARRWAALASRADADSGVMPLSYLDLCLIALDNGASGLWFLGWPDRALARAREAVDLARRLRDPFNLA